MAKGAQREHRKSAGTGRNRRDERQREQLEHRKSAGTGRVRRAEGERDQREHRKSAGTRRDDRKWRVRRRHGTAGNARRRHAGQGDGRERQAMSSRQGGRDEGVGCRRATRKGGGNGRRWALEGAPAHPWLKADFWVSGVLLVLRPLPA